MRFYSLMIAATLTWVPLVATSQSTPELVIQTGHFHWPKSLAFNKSGSMMLSEDFDGIGKIWDVKQAKEIITLTGSNQELYSIKWHPDENKVFAANDFGLLLADIRDGLFKKVGAPAAAIDVCPAKRILATAIREVQILEVDGLKVIRTWKAFDDPITALAFNPDGTLLIAGTNNGNLKIFEVATGKELLSQPRILGWVRDVEFSPDGQYFLAAGNENYQSLVIGEVASFTVKHKIVGVNCFSASFTADSKAVITTGNNNIASKYDVKTGKKLFETFRSKMQRLRPTAVSPDNKILALGTEKNIEFYDLASTKLVTTLEQKTDRIQALCFSPDGKLLLSGSMDNVYLWNLETANLLHTFTNRKLYDVDNNSEWDYLMESLLFSPDGKFFYFAINVNGIIKTEEHETASGRLTRVMPFEDSYRLVAITPDNKQFILTQVRTAESDDPKDVKSALKIWNAETLKTKLLGQVNGIFRKAWLSEEGAKLTVLQHLLGGSIAKEHYDMQKFKSLGGSVLASQEESFGYRSFDIHSTKDIVAYTQKDTVVLVREGATKKILMTTSVSGHYGPYLFLNPAGTMLAGGGYDKDLYLFDLAAKSQKRLTPTVHQGPVFTMAFSPDSKLVAAGGLDGQISVWNVSQGKLLCRLIAINGNSYLSINKDNYYRASKNAHHGVAFRMNGKVFPFEQFDIRLNRPDLVAASVGLASDTLVQSYKRAYRKRLQKMNFREEDFSSNLELPEIKILTNNLPLSTDKKTLDLQVEVLDKKSSISRLYIYINDVPVFGSGGKEFVALPNQARQETLSLELTAGRNKIQVSAVNKNGLESLRETIEVNYIGTSPKPDLYLVMIGVSNYIQKDYNLTYAAKDAQDIIAAYKAKQSNYGQVKVLEFLNENATREKILDARLALNGTKPEDQVIVFVAGHGLLDENLDYYIATHDVNFESPATRGLAYADLEDMIDGIKARKKLMLLDACHSGEVDKEETEDDEKTQASGGTVSARGFKGKKKKSVGLEVSFELMQELFADLRRGSGAMVISSASGVEFAFESDAWKNGVFTYSLLEGLKSGKADGNQNKEIKVSELRDYVTKRVTELTEGKQHPTSRQENLEFDFNVW